MICEIEKRERERERLSNVLQRLGSTTPSTERLNLVQIAKNIQYISSLCSYHSLSSLRPFVSCASYVTQRTSGECAGSGSIRYEDVNKSLLRIDICSAILWCIDIAKSGQSRRVGLSLNYVLSAGNIGTSGLLCGVS